MKKILISALGTLVSFILLLYVLNSFLGLTRSLGEVFTWIAPGVPIAEIGVNYVLALLMQLVTLIVVMFTFYLSIGQRNNFEKKRQEEREENKVGRQKELELEKARWETLSEKWDKDREISEKNHQAGQERFEKLLGELKTDRERWERDRAESDARFMKIYLQLKRRNRRR